MRYFVLRGQEKTGPYTLSQLKSMWKSGSVTGDLAYCDENSEDWLPLTELEPQLDGDDSPYSVQTQHFLRQQSQVVRVAKRRGTFIILGLLLGSLGIHNFYAGYYGKGAVQLSVTVILAWIFVGPLISAIWAVIEVLTVKEDAAGEALV